MKKKLSRCEIAVFELENANVIRLARSVSSELQEPILVMLREPVITSGCTSLWFRLYIKSHLSPELLLVKQFPSLDDFCLFYATSKLYSNFKFVNYSCL